MDIHGSYKQFKKLSPIEQYKYLETLRSILRNVQKLSWRITQFDRKFPLEAVKSDDYKDVMSAYIAFCLEINKLIPWDDEKLIR